MASPERTPSKAEFTFHQRMQNVLETGEGDVNRAKIVLENAARRQEARLTGLRGTTRTSALETLSRQAA